MTSSNAGASVVHYAYNAPRLKPSFDPGNLRPCLSYGDYFASGGQCHYARDIPENPFAGMVISIEESYFTSLAGKTVSFKYKTYGDCEATGGGACWDYISCFSEPYPCDQIGGLVSSYGFSNKNLNFVRINENWVPNKGDPNGGPPFYGLGRGDGFSLSLAFSDTKEIVAWSLNLIPVFNSECYKYSSGDLRGAAPAGDDGLYCSFEFNGPNFDFRTDGPGSWTVIPAPPALLGAVSGMLALWGIGRRRRAAAA